jgi:hypothetical protein
LRATATVLPTSALPCSRARHEAPATVNRLEGFPIFFYRPFWTECYALPAIPCFCCSCVPSCDQPSLFKVVAASRLTLCHACIGVQPRYHVILLSHSSQSVARV